VNAPAPQRVTVVGSLPPQRGISAYCHDLAAALANVAGVDLEFVAFRSLYPPFLYPGGAREAPGASERVIPGARVRRDLTWWNPFGWVGAGLTARGDIVHAQWWSYALAPAYLCLLASARLRRRKVVLTVHNARPHEGGMLARMANRAVLPLAHHIIVHTRQGADALVAAGVSARRIDVVPMGVPEPRVRDAAETRAARRQLGLSLDARVVLFLGNIRPYKGVMTLLEAFTDVVREVPDARLLVAGQPWGDTGEEIRERVGALGLNASVELRLEYVTEEVMDACFIASDVVVYPYTHFDAQSAAACDALRYGRAIIVTRTGGLPELASDPGVILEPGDRTSLAGAIVAVLRDGALRAALEAGARTKARERSWTLVAGKTTPVYARLLEAPTDPRAVAGPNDEYATVPADRGTDR
jgi:glycosyltransferase involved in cell wall biosynthesis